MSPATTQRPAAWMMESPDGRARARSVQATPSGDVRSTDGTLLEGEVVATINDEVAPTAVKSALVPAGRAVQAAPSGEVSTIPSRPTTTNCYPGQSTLRRSLVVVEVAEVQVDPSADVRMVPARPTATHSVPEPATEDSSPPTVALRVQVKPD